MPSSPGLFIVLEGADGSGKGTQFRLLKERLQAVGYNVEVFDFPRYDQPSSYFVAKYLNGAYGPALAISPYTASLFFALDRYEAGKDIKAALEAGRVVLANRYVGSNMAHQGAKFEDPIEQRGFFVWEDSLEFELLGIPRPDVNLFLRVPAEISYELIKQKHARSYTDKSHDEHEKDVNYLRRSVATYDLLCELFPKDFKAIECTYEGKLKSITDINNQIWTEIKPQLPLKPEKKGHSVKFNLHEAQPPRKTTVENRSEETDISLALASEISLFDPSAIQYDIDWQKTNYDYFVPADLPPKLSKRYQDLIKQIVSGHKAVVQKLKKAGQNIDMAQRATPLAALVGAKLSLNEDSAEKLAGALSVAVIGEFEKLLADIGLNVPLRQPEAINNILKRYGFDGGQMLAATREPIKLIDYTPRRELQLLLDILYPYSGLSREEIELDLDKRSYQQKADSLVEALNDTRGGFEGVNYIFDAVAERLEFIRLKATSRGTAIKLQPATPRYGYEVDEVLEAADAADEFVSCFDASLGLYSAIQASELTAEAAYATLIGHKNRAEVRISLPQLREIISQGERPRVAAQMAEKVAEVHPVVAENLIIKPLESRTKAKPKTRARRRRTKKHR